MPKPPPLRFRCSCCGRKMDRISVLYPDGIEEEVCGPCIVWKISGILPKDVPR